MVLPGNEASVTGAQAPRPLVRSALLVLRPHPCDQAIEVDFESRQEQQERETEQGQHLQRQVHLYKPEDGGADHYAGYNLKDHRGKMQFRCEAESERHREGYRCDNQYSRERDIGHHKSIFCGVCCLDLGSDMIVHLDEHLMLVPGRLNTKRGERTRGGECRRYASPVRGKQRHHTQP